MTEELMDRVLGLIQGKIKEPIQDDLMLAGYDHVRAKLLIQGRSLSDVDNEYLAELIAESTLQLVVSCESARLLESLSIFSRLIITS